MSDKVLHWNKTIPYYELPLIIHTNLCDEDLEYINNNFNFLLTESPVFKLFYTEFSPEFNFNSINYSNYAVQTHVAYTLNELLEIIYDDNFLKSKKIFVVHAIKKHINYYTIRFVEVPLKHLNGNPLSETSFFKSLVRKEKIKLLSENDNNKKSFKNFVYDLKSINPEMIISKEIKGFNI